jgi:hypothetical protein
MSSLIRNVLLEVDE